MKGIEIVRYKAMGKLFQEQKRLGLSLLEHLLEYIKRYNSGRQDVPEENEYINVAAHFRKNSIIAAIDYQIFVEWNQRVEAARGLHRLQYAEKRIKEILEFYERQKSNSY